MRATSQLATVAAVQPASHHRPSFSSSPPMKPTDVDAAHRLIQSTSIRQPSPPRPPPLPMPTAGPLASTAAAGCMIGSHSHPLVGSTRQTGLTAAAVQNAATTVPRRLLTESEYMHRFRFLFARVLEFHFSPWLKLMALHTCVSHHVFPESQTHPNLTATQLDYLSIELHGTVALLYFCV